MLEEIVKKYKNESIIGQTIDLVPANEKFFENIVAIRNQDRSRYFLCQDFFLTFDMQRAWYSKYLERMDDIYWCVVDKQGGMVGTIRIYDINENDCNQGSFIISEDKSMGMPYALETEILSLEFAFDVLHVNEVINEDRNDNKMMKSMSKKMGFKFDKVIDRDGVPYYKYILKREDSKVEKYKSILKDFMDR